MAPLSIPYHYGVSTGSQCRKTDRLTIGNFGLDGFTLMETAGLQAARRIATLTSDGAEGLYLCGKGNNGGDALVVARYLAIHHAHRCRIFFPEGADRLSRESRKNLELLHALQKQGVPVTFEPGMRIAAGTYSEESSGTNSGYIVDGLLGTGLSSELRDPILSLVQEANRLSQRFSIPLFSLDIPTGLHADTGKILGDAVRATHTLSFGARKLGFYLNEGPLCTGTVHQLDLSFPLALRETAATLLLPELAPELPPIRRHARHKYSDRAVFVVAGSEGLTGAAIMTASAAWKAGTGAVFLFAPKGILPIYESTLPGIIKIPLGGPGDTFFTEKHSGTVLRELKKREGVLLIGPGLGRDENTHRFCHAVLEQYDEPVVMDADALRIPEIDSLLKSGVRILTPHPGEVASLNGSPPGGEYERILWADEYARSNRVWMVSKGSPLFVGSPEGNNYLTGYDNRIFARAGFGDLLSGTIAGNLAISGDPELSIIRALLDSWLKAVNRQKSLHRPLEPMDLL